MATWDQLLIDTNRNDGRVSIKGTYVKKDEINVNIKTNTG